MKKKQLKQVQKFYNLITIFLMVIILGLCFLIVLGSSSSTFNIIAQTERVQFKANKKLESGWHFENVLIKEDVFIDSLYRFTGSISVPINTMVSIERVSYGQLKILFNGLEDSLELQLKNDTGSLIKTIRNTQNIQIFIDNLEQRFRTGSTIVLPIIGLNGIFETGRPVLGYEDAEYIIPLLRSGNVRLMRQSLFNTGLIEVGNFDLEMGDQFTITTQDSEASGFVTINENPNLSLVFSVKGEAGKIIKPGGEERYISTSIITRIANDRLLSILSLFLGAVFAIITLLSFYMNYILFKLSIK